MKYSCSLGLKSPTATQQGLSYEVPFSSLQTQLCKRTLPFAQKALTTVLISQFVRCDKMELPLVF